MTVDGVTVTSSGLFDVFLAKYSANRHLTLVRSERRGTVFGYSSRAGGRMAPVNIAIVGEFQGTATFGTRSVPSRLDLGDAFYRQV
jgi:hypothetical protein